MFKSIMAGFSSTKKPNLPGHYQAKLVKICPANEASSYACYVGPEILCMLLDELRNAHEQDRDEMFVNERVSIVRAYDEGRLYGLRVKWNEDMQEHDSFQDPIFMKNSDNMVGNLPCFVVIDKPYDYDTPSKCHYIWTAPRARNLGLATYMLNETDVRAVDNPTSVDFWEKYLTRVLAECEG